VTKKEKPPERRKKRQGKKKRKERKCERVFVFAIASCNLSSLMSHGEVGQLSLLSLLPTTTRPFEIKPY
jgi:hypothetical protein